MNILASFTWLKEFIRTHEGAEDFARELSLKSMSVESMTDLSARYEQIVVGVIEAIEAHPNAERLRLAKTSIGKKTVTVVCGGKNIAVGQRVAVALPGALVRWHGEGELVKLENAKIRGVESEGMICAANEIGFDSLPQGEGEIWDLTAVTSASAGTPFADAFDLHDTIFDIEITTNRPDAMGMIGLAREGAAAIGADFEPPSLPAIPKPKQSIPLAVSVMAPNLCPRYMAVALKGVRIAPSPFWLQKRLLLAGKKPINNIVDITNYVLLEYGQPMHAFDYENVSDGKIIVRKAKKDEEITVLDGSTHQLKETHLVIADAQMPLAIAGIMGGKISGVSETTQAIIFEAATFDAVSIRKTAREVNLHSDSKVLFEKGLSMEAPEAALARAVELTLEIAGGEVASEVIDIRAHSSRPLLFPFSPEHTRKLLGVNISNEDQLAILKRLGFSAKKIGEIYEITVPFWRDHDIENAIDFTEEIARIYGYHQMQSTLPVSAPPIFAGDKSLVWEDWLKNTIASFGFTECYGYSFTNAEDLHSFGLKEEDALAIFNPLSSDLTFMRPTLMPSLLRTIERNQGEERAADLFELARVYLPVMGDLPREESRLVLAKYGFASAEIAWREMKGVFEALADSAGLSLTFERKANKEHWHISRSAVVFVNGMEIGILGEISATDHTAFGLKVPVLAAEINVEKLIPLLKHARVYHALPTFPSILRDLAIIVSEKTVYAEIKEAIRSAHSLIKHVELSEVYRGKGIAEGKKSLTFSLELRADDRTLEGEVAEEVMAKVMRTLEEKFDAQIR